MRFTRRTLGMSAVISPNMVRRVFNHRNAVDSPIELLVQ